MVANDDFDDFLGLRGSRLRGVRLLVFAGASGSGKSTAMRFLQTQHPQFCDTPSTVVSLCSARHEPGDPRRLMLVEEVRHPSSLSTVFQLLRWGHTVAVASHVPLVWYAPFRLIWRCRFFQTDCDTGKICRYLARQRLRFTEAAVADFCRHYRANYLDVKHILERFPVDDFDHAYAAFQRLCRIDCGE